MIIHYTLGCEKVYSGTKIKKHFGTWQSYLECMLLNLVLATEVVGLIGFIWKRFIIHIFFIIADSFSFLYSSTWTRLKKKSKLLEFVNSLSANW